MVNFADLEGSKIVGGIVKHSYRELRSTANGLIHWANGLSNAEKLLLFCVVILCLFVIVVRGTDRRRGGRNEVIQFFMAMALVVGAGFSAGWYFDIPH